MNVSFFITLIKRIYYHHIRRVVGVIFQLLQRLTNELGELFTQRLGADLGMSPDNPGQKYVEIADVGCELAGDGGE